MATKNPKKKAARPRSAKAAPAADPLPAAQPAAVASGQGAPSSAWRWVLGAVVVLGLAFALKGRVAPVPTVALIQEGPVSTRGTGPGQVLGCRHVAMDAEGDVAWLFGGGDQMSVQTFSPRGAFLSAYKARGAAETLKEVNSMAFDAQGELWLCEKGSGRVVHLSKDLKFLGSFSTDDKDLTGLAVDADGLVWVCARDARIDIFDADGKLQREFRGTPQMPSWMPTAWPSPQTARWRSTASVRGASRPASASTPRTAAPWENSTSTARLTIQLVWPGTPAAACW
jgi:hypothetical protein